MSWNDVSAEVSPDLSSPKPYQVAPTLTMPRPCNWSAAPLVSCRAFPGVNPTVAARAGTAIRTAPSTAASTAITPARTRISIRRDMNSLPRQWILDSSTDPPARRQDAEAPSRIAPGDGRPGQVCAVKHSPAVCARLCGGGSGIGRCRAALDNAGAGGVWNHVNAVPADGTLVNGSPTGQVYRFAGGAPLYISTWDEVGVRSRPPASISRTSPTPANPASGATSPVR